MSKQAYIVIGPEASGTKYHTKLLIAAGCYGQSGNAQWVKDALDDNLTFEVAPVVLRLSCPHGGVWPDLQEYIWKLRSRGYVTHTIVCVRDAYCNVMSQATYQTHAFTRDHAQRKISEAYRRIFEGLIFAGTPFTMSSIEALCLGGDPARVKLIESLGLTVVGDELPEAHNVNEKYYCDYGDGPVLPIHGEGVKIDPRTEPFMTTVPRGTLPDASGIGGTGEHEG